MALTHASAPQRVKTGGENCRKKHLKADRTSELPSKCSLQASRRPRRSIRCSSCGVEGADDKTIRHTDDILDGRTRPCKSGPCSRMGINTTAARTSEAVAAGS